MDENSLKNEDQIEEIVESVELEQKPNQSKRVITSKGDQIMKQPKNLNFQTAILAIVIVIAGVASGYGLNKVTASGSSESSSSTSSLETASKDVAIEVGKTYGSDNEEEFSDEAKGVLIKGGFEGEGTHRLLRPGGESQTVCLTSSVMDLSLFEGHEVEVWGATFDTQKCAWFMDAGRITPITLNAELPFEIEE